MERTNREQDLVLRRRLTAAVAEWRRQAGEAADYLLAGGRLDQFERWAAATTPTLTAGEGSLLAGPIRRDGAVIPRPRVACSPYCPCLFTPSLKAYEAA